jgi:hypothetical protein
MQEFAWSERELPGRRAERRSGLCGPAESCPMDTEPMFCFETSLKMLYWSMLVYRYEEVGLLQQSLNPMRQAPCPWREGD